ARDCRTSADCAGGIYGRPAILVVLLAAGGNMGILFRIGVTKDLDTVLRIEGDTLQDRMAFPLRCYLHVLAAGRGAGISNVGAAGSTRVHEEVRGVGQVGSIGKAGVL